MSGLGPEDAADISLAVIDVVVVVGPVARAVDGGAAEKKARHAQNTSTDVLQVTSALPLPRVSDQGEGVRLFGRICWQPTLVHL